METKPWYIIFLCYLFAFPQANSEEYPGVLGEWNNQQAAWAEQGFDLDLALTQEFLHNSTGAATRGTGTSGNIGFTLAIDTEHAQWWSGGT